MSNFYCENGAAFSSKNDCWETPKELFEKLDNVYHFTLDPCSTDENAKCSKHYTIKDDGLSKDWSNEIVFCNPPYNRDISKWVRKCYEESKHAKIIMLIPARTDTAYFHDYIYHKANIIFIRGRLKFEIDGKPLNSAPFPSMIVEFDNA